MIEFFYHCRLSISFHFMLFSCILVHMEVLGVRITLSSGTPKKNSSELDLGQVAFSVKLIASN